MVEEHDNPKVKRRMLSTLDAEVIVFRTTEVCDVVRDLDKIVQGNDLCERLTLSDTELFIPQISLDSLVSGLISIMGACIDNGENIAPLVHNFIVTEMMDPPAGGQVGTMESESVQTLTQACIHLIKKILEVYDFTHSRTDGRHEYELLRITRSGALIVCRFGADH